MPSVSWLNLKAERRGDDLAIDLDLGKQANVTVLETWQVNPHFGTAAQGGVDDVPDARGVKVKEGLEVFMKCGEVSEVPHDGLKLCARAPGGVGDDQSGTIRESRFERRPINHNLQLPARVGKSI